MLKSRIDEVLDLQNESIENFNTTFNNAMLSIAENVAIIAETRRKKAEY